jgi:hypothetical protein
MYRGILMPFTSNGEAIDFIYGVINWKEIADSATSERIARDAAGALAAAPAVEVGPVWADGPNSEPLVIDEDAGAPGESFHDAPWKASAWDEPALPFDAGLADRLSAARECAEAAAGADARSRSALYRALGLAYDFALAAETAPEDYAEMLEDAGIKAQARAPMTAVAKLVFAAADKARLTEFAAALAWGRRQALELGGFTAALEAQEGGLKAWVAAERRARRPEAAALPASGEEARARLRAVRPLGHLDLPGEEEFVLLVARRDEVGGLAILAPVDDKALLERALRKAAI